ncbi:MAG: LpxI family protein [Firmicutes bacterium]|nr:LpxI family protein [Bacillota bacterium]HOB22085.1 UDP-2,3-diacylglucosamine diphosphatase LpxI [Bacillota bacterium]HQD39590.1 UDP-2,3-diacylglucosamine diphosphatase LpxI [Bacillota bacterium]
METVGIIAGFGKLPSLCTREAQAAGYKVAIFDLVPSQLFLLPPEEQEQIAGEREALRRQADIYFTMNFAELSKLIELLHEHGIKQVVSIGKVRKEALFHNVHPDERLMRILTSLPLHNDNALLEAIADEFQREGIKVLSQLHFLSTQVPRCGVLTEKQPTEELWQDIRYGHKIAKAIAGLDVGQAVVVKDKTILAVESLEGTDSTIRRGAELGGDGVVVVKVSKPQQDLRFDLPVIGSDTLKTVAQVKGRVLAFDADLTVLVDKDELIAQADDAGVILVALGEEAK